MERSDRDKKAKSFRVSRPLEKETLSAKDRFREYWKKVQDLVKGKSILLIGLSLFIMLVNTPSLLIPPRHFQVGEVAPYDIKAKQDLLVEDQTATELKKQETAAAAPAVYDFDEEAVTAVSRAFNCSASVSKKAPVRPPQREMRSGKNWIRPGG
jgi:membrane-associated HD superfamily phosphohydrolase